MDRAEIRIGVSGWTYTPWRGAFYPPKLPQRLELLYAAHAFNALEINGTFYGMQVPKSFAAWFAETPGDFVFAVKAPRYITHMLKLRNADAAVANFFASGVLALGHKLGPILWQFPARFTFHAEVLESFFSGLPRTAEQAAEFALRHDHRLRAPPHLEIEGVGPIRHAIEIRHDSFRTPEFIALLRKHDIALVCADTVEWPLLMDLTSDFVYCRLHGSTELYRSGYDDADLRVWANRVMAWAEGRMMTDGEFILPPLDDGKRRDVFFFFDNTDKLHAPGNARDLAAMVGMPERRYLDAW